MNTSIISLDQTIVIATIGIQTMATYLSESYIEDLISFLFECILDIEGKSISSMAKAKVPMNNAIL